MYTNINTALVLFGVKFVRMKRLLTLSVFICFLLMIDAQPVQAQFWKKIFKKEDKRKPKKPKQDTTTKKDDKKEKLKSKKAPEYPESKLSNTYRVDVLLPLHLNSLVHNGKPAYKQIPDGSLIGVNFYEGLRIACDTLATQGIKMEVYVHDIYDAAGKVDYLLANKIMDSTDLIIGAVQSNDIPQIAAFAKKRSVNFISALSPADAGVKDNPYFILVQPALHTHIRAIVDCGKRKFSNERSYILYRDNENEKEGYSLLKKWLKDAEPTEVKCASNITVDNFKHVFDSTKKNIVYVSFIETGYAEKVLQTLAKMPSKYKFEVLGMPSWKAMYSITQTGNYPDMNIYFTTPFYFDPTTAVGQYINQEYKKYASSKPAEMVYRAYETTHWAGHLLHRYGKYFNEHIKDVSAANFTKYDIEPEYSDENDFLYMENKELNIYRYSNGSYSVE